ncbi:hypothetical protein VNO77_01712 [Canavalia gladiata]|uniref:Uncharacterized protein n=1 Tax=Canavalia gladiata TaxID=3824 RepID=A0AAN9R579_CANGL
MFSSCPSFKYRYSKVEERSWIIVCRFLLMWSRNADFIQIQEGNETCWFGKRNQKWKKNGSSCKDLNCTFWSLVSSLSIGINSEQV